MPVLPLLLLIFMLLPETPSQTGLLYFNEAPPPLSSDEIFDFEEAFDF